MTFIRLVLTVLLFPAFALFVRGVGQRSKALRGIALFVGLGVAGVIINFPGLLDQSARGLGLNSGADLALYVLVLGLVSLAGYCLAKFRRLDQKIDRLVHNVAVRTATSDSVAKNHDASAS